MSKRLTALIVAMCLAWIAAGFVLIWPEKTGGGNSSSRASDRGSASDSAASVEDAPESGPFAIQDPGKILPVAVRFHRPPAAGILFDVDTGEVLWQRNETAQLPIASLTKMMTALIIVENHQPDENVLISQRAHRTRGSGVGILPVGKKVPLEPLLDGLLMVSGNDAAIALAEHDAGSIDEFVARMNERARELGLACTHFTTPSGLRDRDNYSCADDLAQLARADLSEERIRAITARRSAAPPFPIPGGKLHLATNNPFILLRRPGVTGLKTGYTSKAGRCYVTTQRLDGRQLGVVLLDSPNPLRQVPELLQAGFATSG